MINTPKATKCGKKDPSTCRLHGARVVNGIPSPIAPLPSAPKSPGAGQGERQIHGFKNETRVVEKYDLLHLKKSYTHPWDAMTKEDVPMPVSIKTKSFGGSIEMGDFFRNASKSEDFYLHVSFWQGDKEFIVAEHALLLPGKVWSSFFPQDCHEDIRKLLREASNDKSYDAKWTAECAKLKEKWEGFGSIIKLAPKRDHKSQKRMQCVIPNGEFLKLDTLYRVDCLPKGPKAKV
jgi:hypothetical protein